MSNIVVKNYKGVEVEWIKNTPPVNSAEMQLKDAILDKILEANDIDVPQDLVDDEVAMMILELNHKLKYESLASGRYIGLTQDDLTDQMKTFKDEAFKLVKTRLVLKGIIEAEDFEITKDELEDEAMAMSFRQQIPIEMVKDFLGEELEPLKDDLLIRKAIDLINVNAVVKY